MQAKTGTIKRLAPIGGDARSDPLKLTHEFLADNHVVGFDNLAERAHPFIALRSKLMKHVHESGQRVFAVTSVQPGNGKTHVGVNLAAVLSRIAPTRLIELDLRRPTIGTRLGLGRPSIGIDDFLDGNARWQDSAEPIHGFDLTVHRVRQPRADAGTLLGSLRTRQLFEAIRELPDAPICIIDTGSRRGVDGRRGRPHDATRAARHDRCAEADAGGRNRAQQVDLKRGDADRLWLLPLCRRAAAWLAATGASRLEPYPALINHSFGKTPGGRCGSD
jgi:hypothetical protein